MAKLEVTTLILQKLTFANQITFPARYTKKQVMKKLSLLMEYQSLLIDTIHFIHSTQRIKKSPGL
jgi:hypothetical protein